MIEPKHLLFKGLDEYGWYSEPGNSELERLAFQVRGSDPANQRRRINTDTSLSSRVENMSR